MRSTISVAMCTFNGAKYVEDQLQSIAQQHRLPDELVVCDDRSSDETVSIVRQFAKNAPFDVSIVVNDKNLRSTKNFEKAIGLCKGDIIALADQDDIWYPEKLKVLEESFAGDKTIGAVFSDADIVNENLDLLGYRLWEVIEFDEAEKKLAADYGLFHVLLKRNVVTGATMAFRREYFPRMAPIPGIWVHDGWAALIISALAKVVAIDKPLIMYRQHQGNQIGALRASLLDKINKARTTTAIYYDLVNQYQHACGVLGQEPGCEWATAMLGEKVRHQYKRAELSRRGRWSRLPGLLEEVVARRYHRYSNGWRSVARDLVLV